MNTYQITTLQELRADAWAEQANYMNRAAGMREVTYETEPGGNIVVYIDTDAYFRKLTLIGAGVRYDSAEGSEDRQATAEYFEDRINEAGLSSFSGVIWV